MHLWSLGSRSSFTCAGRSCCGSVEDEMGLRQDHARARGRLVCANIRRGRKQVVGLIRTANTLLGIEGGAGSRTGRCTAAAFPVAAAMHGRGKRVTPEAFANYARWRLADGRRWDTIIAGACAFRWWALLPVAGTAL